MAVKQGMLTLKIWCKFNKEQFTTVNELERVCMARSEE